MLPVITDGEAARPHGPEPAPHGPEPAPASGGPGRRHAIRVRAYLSRAPKREEGREGGRERERERREGEKESELEIVREREKEGEGGGGGRRRKGVVRERTRRPYVHGLSKLADSESQAGAHCGGDPFRGHRKMKTFIAQCATLAASRLLGVREVTGLRVAQLARVSWTLGAVRLKA